MHTATTTRQPRTARILRRKPDLEATEAAYRALYGIIASIHEEKLNEALQCCDDLESQLHRMTGKHPMPY